MEPIDPRDKEIAELKALVEKLLAKIADLEARLGMNSSNSSKPPSSDPPSTEKKQKKKKSKGRKSGAQPGHKRHTRKLLPVEEVDKTVDLVPTQCDSCQATLRGTDPNPRRHQVCEIPSIKPHVTEYRCHALECDHCGHLTQQGLPLGVPQGAFGARLMALIAISTGKYRMSKKVVQDFLSDVLGVTLCGGSISNIEQQVSEALASPVDEASAFVRTQASVSMDETSWRQGDKKAWLWVAVTSMVTVFHIALSRSGDVAHKMLDGFSGILTSDRYSAYNWYESGLRQICWAHLNRDFQAWVDRGGVSAVLGKVLLKRSRKMFKWWHRVRDGTMSRVQFQEKMSLLQKEVASILNRSSCCGDAKTERTAKRILNIEASLWTFIYVDGIEPTNNVSEREIRHAVIWRKTSFGTQSADGSRYVERILTTLATLKRQKRNALEFLTVACEASLCGNRSPSLLPSLDGALRRS